MKTLRPTSLLARRFAHLFARPLAWMLAGLLSFGPAHAQSEASVAASVLPLASVAVTGSVTAGASVAAAATSLLLVSGAVFTVKAVALSARGTVYVLERASDGVEISVEVLGRGLSATAQLAGSVVAVSVIGAGVVLSAAGEVLAFIPNALGQALLHNERLTY